MGTCAHRKKEGEKMKVITITNQKGGIGKTTTALCLGAELEQKGYKVLYIDLDKQTDTSRTLRADLNAKGSYEMLADKMKAVDLIQITENGHHVITANDKLATIDSVLNAPARQKGREFLLKESLESIKDKYDYVIIDTLRDLNNATINALTGTDYIIIPATTDSFSQEGIITLLNIVNVIKQYTNKELKTAGILLTMYDNRSNINKAFKEEIERTAEEYGTKVFNTTIRQNVAIRESQALKEPITTYAPKSNANQDYLNFTNELLKDIEG